MSTQYKNMNPFPVVVPSQRGGSFTILPGGTQSEPWFSRFCGSKKLTRIETSVNGNYVQDAKTGDKPATPFQDLVGDVQKESRYYRMVSDIYQCKLCDEYRTGSKEALRRHLKTAHMMDVPDVDYVEEKATETKPAPAKAPAIDPKVKAAVIASAKAAAEEMKEATETPVVAPKTYECDICGKPFKSPAGLKTHKTVKHKESNG